MTETEKKQDFLEQDELARLVVSRVEDYVRDLDGAEGLPIHGMIVAAVERPLFRWAMDKAGQNQKLAAKILGINRIRYTRNCASKVFGMRLNWRKQHYA